MRLGEDEEAFLLRRSGEERRKADASACMVRSVHEELAEVYEERLDRSAAETAALVAMLDRLDR